MNPRPPPPATNAPAVTLTGESPDHVGAAAAEAPQRQAHLPHERDQHPASQQSPQAPNQEVGQQAFSDVSQGLVDTDEGLRKSSVDRRSAQPAQPAAAADGGAGQARPGAAGDEGKALPQRGRPLAPR